MQLRSIVIQKRFNSTKSGFLHHPNIGCNDITQVLR